MKHRQSDSAIWADLLKVEDIYLQGRKILVKNGKNTLFWKDSWLYEKPLCVLYSDLFKICEQPNVTVHQAHNDTQRISFTRWLTDILLLDWQKILNDMKDINFNSEEDTVSWKFGRAGALMMTSRRF